MDRSGTLPSLGLFSQAFPENKRLGSTKKTQDLICLFLNGTGEGSKGFHMLGEHLTTELSFILKTVSKGSDLGKGHESLETI